PNVSSPRWAGSPSIIISEASTTPFCKPAESPPMRRPPVKSEGMSFRRKPESSRRFWTPAFAGVTAVLGLFFWMVVNPLLAVENRADLVFHDFGEERVVDLQIVKKVTGQKKILFLKAPRYTEYLEGFIRGMVVDYSDNPVEGVLVRVGDPGEENAMFDPTVTNFNGIYRVRLDRKSTRLNSSH